MAEESNVMELPVRIRRRPPALAPRQPMSEQELAQSTCAMVLAGGCGKRLQPLTDAFAKPALPFAGSLRIVDFALSNCVHSGIRHIALLTQYQAQSLIGHVASAWSQPGRGAGVSIEVVPAHQPIGQSCYRGTADAVYQNLDLLRASGARFVLVLASDHVYRMDYRRIIAEHVQHNADATVACIEVPLEQAGGYGIVRVDAGGWIREFAEKPTCASPIPGRTGVALASMGIYVFDTEFLCQALARNAASPATRHDFGYDILPALLSDARVLAHDFAGSCVDPGGAPAYWRDVGTLDGYWLANMDFVHADPPFDLHDDHWPILGAPSGLAGARLIPDGHGHHGSAIDSMVCAACVVQGAVVRRSLLFPDVRVGSGSVVEDSLLLPGVSVGQRVQLRRAIVAPGCAIPDGFRIGDDPCADGLRCTVTPQGVTLVTPTMLGMAGV